MDDLDLEELTQLAALAAAPSEAAAPSAAVASLPPLVQALLDVDADGARPGDGDIVPATEVQPVLQRERFVQRGARLCEHMRLAKRLKHAETAVVEAKVQAQRTTQALEIAVRIPGVAQMVGMVQPRAFDLPKAKVYQQLACSARASGRSNKKVGVGQARACALIAEFGLLCQSSNARELLTEPNEFGRRSVCVLSVQWDEASQRLEPLLRHMMPGMRQTKVQTATPVMMMSGMVHRSSDGESSLVASMPWFARGLRLEGLTANDLLEGLARGMPAFVDSPLVLEAARHHATVILHFACDRARANIKALSFVFQYVKERLPENVLPFVEFCGCHGVAIAKTRSYKKTQLCNAAFSLSRLLRVSRNLSGLRDSIIERVERELVVEARPRPSELQRRASDFIELMYGVGFDDDYIWKELPNGKRVKTQFHHDLQAFLDVVDFDPSDGTMRHWCHVAEDGGETDPAQGIGEKRLCCDSRADAVHKVAVPIVNLLTCHAWNPAQAGRWVHVTETLKRIFVFVAGKDILSRGLSEVRTKSGSTKTAAVLSKMIQEDPEDNSAKTQLRLLRCIKAFSDPGVKLDLAVVMVAGKPVENLLYAFLGYNKQRPSLLTMLHPASSPVVHAQCVLLSLAEEFDMSPGSPWQLLDSMGADFASADVRLCARREVLRLAAGVFEVFDLKWSKPPYRWAHS